MSEALVVLNSSVPAVQGVGLSSKLFKLKPSTIELVQKSTRQEGATPGKFRDISNNRHFDTLHVVMLIEPVEQRQWFKGQEFKKENKMCFSLDNIQPHPRAQAPPAMYCNSCPMGDVNWAKWRQTRDPKDLPPCSKYWHLVIATRDGRMPYYFNIKGTGVSVFEHNMDEFGRMLYEWSMNVKNENKMIAEANSKLEPGVEPKPLLPLPNIFDISFHITPKLQNGVWVPESSDFKAVRPEDRKDFGDMYVDFVASRTQIQYADAEETEVNAAVSEAPAQAAVVLPGPNAGPVVGTVVGKDEPITI